jgi:DNA-binding FadR family transcriptional regulator
MVQITKPTATNRKSVIKWLTMLVSSDQRLALQAYKKILEVIMSQQIQPGDLLNERRLAEMLDMSRTRVRYPLLILKGEELLLRQGRRGLPVRLIQVDDFLDALQVRLLLEPAVALMAAGKVAGDILDALEDDLKAVLNNAGPIANRPAGSRNTCTVSSPVSPAIQSCRTTILGQAACQYYQLPHGSRSGI